MKRANVIFTNEAGGSLALSWMGISIDIVKREMRTAKLWLLRESSFRGDE
jgi:hypothetical protein